MTGFQTPLWVSIDDDSQPRPMMTLLASFKYRDEQLGDIAIPLGFRFDGASIPTPAMGLIGWPGVRAACVHDYLLTTAIPREEADAVFGRALEHCGVPATTAFLMHEAVCAYTQELRRQEQVASLPDEYKGA